MVIVSENRGKFILSLGTATWTKHHANWVHDLNLWAVKLSGFDFLAHPVGPITGYSNVTTNYWYTYIVAIRIDSVTHEAGLIELNPKYDYQNHLNVNCPVNSDHGVSVFQQNG